VWQRGYRYQVLALAAVVLGGIIGRAAERLPISAVGRSVVAAVFAWHVGLLIAAFAMAMLSPNAGEGGPASSFLVRVVLTTVLAGIAGGILHALFSWLGVASGEAILNHRAAGIGIIGFMAGAFQAFVRRDPGDA